MELTQSTRGSFRGQRGGSFRGQRGGSFRGQRGGSFRGSRGGSFRGSRGGSFRGSRGGSFRGSRGGSFRGSRGGSFRGSLGSGRGSSETHGSFRGQRGGSFRGQRGGSFRGQRGGSFRGQRGGSFRGQKGGTFGGSEQYHTSLIFKPQTKFVSVRIPPLKSDKKVLMTLSKYASSLHLQPGRQLALTIPTKDFNTLKKMSFEGKKLTVDDISDKNPKVSSAVLYCDSAIDLEVLKTHFDASSCIRSPNGNVILNFDGITNPVSIKREEVIEGKTVTLQYHYSKSQAKNGDVDDKIEEEMETSGINGEEQEEEEEEEEDD